MDPFRSNGQARQRTMDVHKVLLEVPLIQDMPRQRTAGQCGSKHGHRTGEQKYSCRPWLFLRNLLCDRVVYLDAVVVRVVT